VPDSPYLSGQELVSLEELLVILALFEFSHTLPDGLKDILRSFGYSALGYRSPEEFEQRSESLAADSRSAMMDFFENDENGKGVSTGLLGTGTQMPSSSPDPVSC
jgi:hypothetical protein